MISGSLCTTERLFISGSSTISCQFYTLMPWAPTSKERNFYCVRGYFIANNRVEFNIKGNDCRLLVAMRNDKGIGTHAAYDRIDAKTI